MERIQIPPDLFLEFIDVELPYYLIKLGRYGMAETSDFIEMILDGEKLSAFAVKGEEKILLGEVDRRKLKKVEELYRKGLLEAVPYRGAPEGRALCPMCGEPVFDKWQYYMGHYYHKECFLKHYRKFW